MDAREFIKRLVPLAIAEQRRTGVLASITIAQAAIESGWGASAPGNNLFGIKGTGQELVTKEYVNGAFVTVKDGFRVYDCWEGSVKDHSDFLVFNPRYAKAGFFEACKRGDYAEAAKALQAAGYATDPIYQIKLRGVINQYKLYEYDREGMKRMDRWEGDCIINTWIKPSWEEANRDRLAALDAGDKEAAAVYQAVMDSCHNMANAVRRAMGVPEE